MIHPSSAGRAEMTLTARSPTNTNFHPLREALTARSMSSTVVRSFHPPASTRACILHTPAVPADTCIRDRRLLVMHAKREEGLTVEPEERVRGRPYFLLHAEVVIQRHLLEAGQEAFVSIHCTRTDRRG